MNSGSKHNPSMKSPKISMLKTKMLACSSLKFNFTANAHIMSTIYFLAVFCLICIGSIFSNLSLYSLTVEPTAASTRTEDSKSDNVNPLLPPANITEKERIAWFLKNLPRFELLNPSSSTRRFHTRVSEFFDGGCTGRFFMTWFSPASSFRKRDRWAIESLFKVHPHGCLVIASSTLDSEPGYKILNPIIDLGFKIMPIVPDVPFLVKDSPAEVWLSSILSGTQDPGVFFVHNLSNLIRLAILYKYGGTYVDTDVLFLNDFGALRNSIGAQSVDGETGNWTRLNSAVMVFDKGHPLLLKCLEEFSLTYRGSKWGHNGPNLVSRVVNRVAGREGYDFTVLPPAAFYPIKFSSVERLFTRPANGPQERLVKRTVDALMRESYGLHLWNKRSCVLKVEVGSVLARLVSSQCVLCDGIKEGI